MSAASRIAVQMAWASVGLLLLFGALPHFRDGLRIDEALPVPSYMIAGRTLPASAYVHAANVLRAANRANGTSRIAGAEAALDSAATEPQAPVLESALSATPASVRGWVLLARARLPSDRHGAAAALSEALLLAPYDYWVAGMRAQLAAELWSNLDPDSQAASLRQVRLMWSEPQLRPQLLALVSSPQGAALASRAFAGDRDDLVALNRWISAARRQSNPAP